MRGKIWFSRWLIAAAVLAVAECADTMSNEILSSAAHAQYSSDLLRARPQSDRFFQNLFASQNWKRHQRKPHRLSDSTRPSSQPGKSRKPAARPVIATIENVPLPRPRPPLWPEPHSFAEAAGPDFDTADVTSTLSDCDQRLATIATIELLPRLIGPGECGGRDMIRLNAVLLPDHKRVEVKPTAVLRCAMAESFAAWVRDEASAHVTRLGAALRAIDTFGSYECRGRNMCCRCQTKRTRQRQCHRCPCLGSGGGRHIDLTDEAVSKPLREFTRFRLSSLYDSAGTGR